MQAHSSLLQCRSWCSSSLRIHWKLSTILKTSNKIVWSNLFWYGKVHIFWKFIRYTIHRDKAETLKKFIQTIQTLQIMHYFYFLSRAPTYHYFTFNTRFLYELKHKVHFSQGVCQIFDSVAFLLKLTFLINKKHGVWL